MKLDNEFKQETNRAFKEADYVGRKSGIRIIIFILIVSFISAFGGVTYKKWKTDKDREIFKQSVTYNEGKLDDLANYRLQVIQAEDDTSKAAIADYVNSVYANYDESKIENSDLKTFLRDCRNGKYSITTNKGE